MNNYNVTVFTNMGIYNYINVIADNEKEARIMAERDIILETREEVLESNATFVKVVSNKYLLEESEGD